ncbi:alpha-mannosyltransferase, partial [Pterulicium gracile]
GSRGIVLAVGRGQARFAGHLITSIRKEFNLTDLPIQIMHSGLDDLPKEHKEYLINAGGGDTPETAHRCFATDMTTIFNDETVDLRHAGFGVKPFAMLASSFEHTLFLDADAVFLQDPTWGFEFDDYKATGAYFFRDRLMYRNAFRDRSEFYHDLLDGAENPNSQLNKSRVFMEGYAEEMDSGALYLKKSAPGLKLALMFTCWMASKQQKKFVYNKFHGDKESYWIAFELLRVAYRFEERYASVIGWDCTPKDKKGDDPMHFVNNRVCGNNIAHMAAAPFSPKKLFWFNGSILPNYHAHNRLYFVPTHYML